RPGQVGRGRSPPREGHRRGRPGARRELAGRGMSPAHIALLVVGTGFAVVGIAWVVRVVRKLRRRPETPRMLWVLVVERGAAWIVVGLALAFGAFGSASVGRWF